MAEDFNAAIKRAKALGGDADDAQRLADAVICWRELGVDLWLQFSIESQRGKRLKRWPGGLSVLEDLEDGLKRAGLLNSYGQPKG